MEGRGRNETKRRRTRHKPQNERRGKSEKNREGGGIEGRVSNQHKGGGGGGGRVNMNR